MPSVGTHARYVLLFALVSDQLHLFFLAVEPLCLCRRRWGQIRTAQEASGFAQLPTGKRE